MVNSHLNGSIYSIDSNVFEIHLFRLSNILGKIRDVTVRRLITDPCWRAPREGGRRAGVGTRAAGSAHGMGREASNRRNNEELTSEP